MTLYCTSNAAHFSVYVIHSNLPSVYVSVSFWCTTSRGGDVWIKFHTGPALDPGQVLRLQAITNVVSSDAVPTVLWLKDGMVICDSSKSSPWSRIRCIGDRLDVLRSQYEDGGQYCTIMIGVGTSANVSVDISSAVTPLTAGNVPSTQAEHDQLW